MFQGYKTLLYLLAVTSIVQCYCPTDKIHAFGNCSFKITCIGSIRDVALERRCYESINYSNKVQVTLLEANERLDNIDTQFLNIITSLKISANWRESDLAILDYTRSLKSLQLSDIGLQKLISSPFFSLIYLENLDLSHNDLTEIDELFQFERARLKNLSLAYNKIQEMSSIAFEQLTSLHELDLSYNLITDLTEEPFQNLTSLHVLRLNNNRIKDLNGAFNELCKLKHLFVRGNQIQNINEESLKILEHLETFDSSFNELDVIQPILFSRHWDHFDNHSICKIIISENHISLIPNGTDDEMKKKRSVDIQTELNLSMNSITHIEYNAFQSLIRIISLDLSQNKITSFVVNSQDLEYLQYLNMSNNYVTQLYYESFSQMNNLQNLDLSNNRLDFIPDMTFNNNNLKLLNMTFNEIETIDRLHITMFHPEGGVLDLSNNKLFKLIVPYGEGLRLITLIIHSNNITDPSLITLNQQSGLLHLDISRNQIQILDSTSLHLPETLISLDLGCNQINSMGPSTFHDLRRLETLRLNHNYLTQLEYGTFQGLKELRSLDLSYNRITYLDSKYLMDLKSLRFLSVRANGLNFIDYKSLYGHKYEVLTYVDNNYLSCEWLSNALRDFNNEYSKMRPTVLIKTRTNHSIDDIPCEVVVEPDTKLSKYVMADERLLLTSQNILKAVRLQNNYLWTLMQKMMQEESAKYKNKADNRVHRFSG